MMSKRLFTLSILLTASIAVFIYSLSGEKASEPIFSLEKFFSSQDESAQWFKIKRTKKVKGVALVVHGLNLNPARMHAITLELNDMGIDVLNLSLHGHGDNYLKNQNLSSAEARLVSFQTVTYRLWMTEVYQAYLKVRERALIKKVPVYFVGYSLGGLMGCDLMLLHPDVFYDRMVLFAPAFSITMESYLLKALTPFPDMVIDSISPLSYRSNKGTPMAAYKALFEAVDYFDKNANDKLNKPTLVFMDENDEFVPLEKLIDRIAQSKLDRWKVYLVQKDNNVGRDVSHHLIIDQDGVGGQMWKQMTDVMRRHLRVGF